MQHLPHSHPSSHRIPTPPHPHPSSPSHPHPIPTYPHPSLTPPHPQFRNNWANKDSGVGDLKLASSDSIFPTQGDQFYFVFFIIPYVSSVQLFLKN